MARGSPREIELKQADGRRLASGGLWDGLSGYLADDVSEDRDPEDQNSGAEPFQPEAP